MLQKPRCTAIPPGVRKTELRLKDKQKLKGTRGPLSESGFSLIDPQDVGRQIAPSMT